MKRVGKLGRLSILVLGLTLAGCGFSTPGMAETAGAPMPQPATTSAPVGGGTDSGDGSGSVPDNRLDACTILTPEDAQGYFGDASPPPASPFDTGDMIFTCVYANDNGYGLNILIRRATDQAESDSIYNQAREGVSESAIDVSGLGDAAYFDTHLQQLGFKKGLYWVLLSGSGPIGTDNQAALTALGQAVLSRLP